MLMDPLIYEERRKKIIVVFANKDERRTSGQAVACLALKKKLITRTSETKKCEESRADRKRTGYISSGFSSTFSSVTRRFNANNKQQWLLSRC
ncbi:Uncharacterized protein APZ42_015783 [Daphnia magna]|uniref:Uncharacterized protein n=1 Tax=Daphnia magna TaxID=35525 RepID=A0A162NCC6_9CRUS|nr:Uncharacterized protein APZ42_015783 [Daphnia magna]